MVSLWITIGLILATISVATLGAGFSVWGLAALFSGAAMAVAIMAASLEFAKFVIAAYLHNQWYTMNKVFRAYLTAAIVVLSIITSMGIFGFLSDAYQSSTQTLEAETINRNLLKTQLDSAKAELARQTKLIDDIPANRITKRMQARTEAEPIIEELNLKIENSQKAITESELKILEVKKRVGPLLYISRAFEKDLDTTVKYLILTLVFVFDPLAICLVLASTGAIESRRRKIAPVPNSTAQAAAPPPPQEKVIKMRFADEEKTAKSV